MIGTPFKKASKRIMLLGSGELGKEVVLSLAGFGVEVWACDRYENAPAMQVAQHSLVLDMLDAGELRKAVEKVNPHLIIPEIEAIATEELVKLEEQGFVVVPTARAVRLTMDREGIRRLAKEELGLPTADYRFASTFAEFQTAVENIGLPCVVKPIMSSSGKGQSVIRKAEELSAAWHLAQEGGRVKGGKVIVEEFIHFDSEITLLTVRAVNGTQFCDPIGHRQVDGDYVESWQPHKMTPEQLKSAHLIADKITENLGGFGLFGVELFLLKDGRVLFSEVSPRPHDTGLVTIATQQWSEFSLHARAVLGFPIAQIKRYEAGASVAIKAPQLIQEPVYEGHEAVLAAKNTDLRIFGKPNATQGRRMAVVFATSETSAQALDAAKLASQNLILRDL